MDLQIVKGLPFTLADGTIVLPEVNASGSRVVSMQTQEAEEEIEHVLDNIDLSEYEQPMQRTLAHVPIDNKSFAVHMAIISMTAWGLPDFAIGAVLGADADTIADYKAHEIHAQLVKQVIEGIRFAETASIHGYLAQKAKLAAVTVASELNSKDADRRMTAAKDILDRSGFRPVDRVEHTHSFENELRITMTRKKEPKQVMLEI